MTGADPAVFAEIKGDAEIFFVTPGRIASPRKGLTRPRGLCRRPGFEGRDRLSVSGEKNVGTHVRPTPVLGYSPPKRILAIHALSRHPESAHAHGRTRIPPASS